jgi:hypothetical protein
VIHEKALAIAGPDAHLVARPAGVLHVYNGPLTRCAHVPRAARPLCRARTRQLTADRDLSPSITPLTATPASCRTRRLCARCTARLTRDGGRAVPTLRSRRDYLAAHSRTTAHDLVFALKAAETPAEVDAVAHLTLALFDVPKAGIPHPTTGRSLTDEVIAARTRVHGWPESVYAAVQRFDDLSMAASEARKARGKEIREERIATWEASRPTKPHQLDTTTHEGATHP